MNWRRRVLFLVAGILLTFTACTGPAPFLTSGGTDSSGGGNTPGVVTGSPRSATGEKAPEEGSPDEVAGGTDPGDLGSLPPPEQTNNENRATRSGTTQNQPLGGGIVAPDHITPGELRPPIIGSLSVCQWPGFESHSYHLEGQIHLPLPDASDPWGWSWQLFPGPGQVIVLKNDGTTAEAPLKTVTVKVDGMQTNPFGIGEIPSDEGFVLKKGFFEVDFIAPKEPYPPSVRFRLSIDPGVYEDIPGKKLDRDEKGRIILGIPTLYDKLPKAPDIPLCEGFNLLRNFIP